MKVLDIHIIQSYPVNCLNRDENNSPKVTTFGGVRRARISSQSYKRAVREKLKELAPDIFSGVRTRYIAPLFKEVLLQVGFTEEESNILSTVGTQCYSVLDIKDPQRSKTIMYLDKSELVGIAKLWKEDPVIKGWLDSGKAIKWHDFIQEAGVEKDAKNFKVSLSDTKHKFNYEYKADKKSKKATLNLKYFQKYLKQVPLKEGIDIKLFGRFMSAHEDLTVAAAGSFAHAFSTHAVHTESDFFAAVDENLPAASSGAAITNTMEYNTATYYKFISINLTDFTDSYLASNFTDKEKKEVISLLIQAILFAVPSAKSTSMNAGTLPSYVLGAVRDKSQSANLANAFEKPVTLSEFERSDNKSYINLSVEAFRAYFKKTHDMGWFDFADIKTEVELSEINLDEFEKTPAKTVKNVKTFVKELVKHV